MSEEPAWNIIYPVYIDKKYSLRQGRRVPKDVAVEKPTVLELQQMCQALKIPCAIESEKRHPATPRNMGRLRYKLKNEAGEFYNPDIDSKDALLLSFVEKIGTLASRQVKVTPAITNAPAGKGKKKR